MAFAGTTQKCSACEKTVYLVDKLAANNRIFHKSCFRCHHCKGTLKVHYIYIGFNISVVRDFIINTEFGIFNCCAIMHAAEQLLFFWGGSILQASLWPALQAHWKSWEEFRRSDCVLLKLSSSYQLYLSICICLLYYWFIVAWILHAGTPKLVKPEKTTYNVVWCVDLILSILIHSFLYMWRGIDVVSLTNLSSYIADCSHKVCVWIFCGNKRQVRGLRQDCVPNWEGN